MFCLSNLQPPSSGNGLGLPLGKLPSLLEIQEVPVRLTLQSPWKSTSPTHTFHPSSHEGFRRCVCPNSAQWVSTTGLLWQLLGTQCNVCACYCLSRVQLFATPWTVAQQAPLSMGFSRQEYWSGLWFPSPGDLPYSGFKLTSLISPALAVGFFTTSATWEAPGNGILALSWGCWGMEYLLSAGAAKLVTEKLGEMLLSVKSTQNKTEQRDGERNIPEDSVGAFQFSCAPR